MRQPFGTAPPKLFQLKAGKLYIQLASDKDRRRVLRLIKDNLDPERRVFVGVIDHIDPKAETAEEVCDRVLEAAEYVPIYQLGTTDDCGFSPFGDDLSTARDLAFEIITARILGTALAAKRLEQRIP